MSRPKWEVADVIRRYGAGYLASRSVPTSQRRVLRAVETCRTAALGGHVEACEECGVCRVSYNSCRNRHCPKCQAGAAVRWLEARLDDLLPVEYFHVVFTVPARVAEIGLANKRLFYNILFRSTAETLLTLAADPKHLGAEIGFSAVLHTWGQNLSFHPHLHCIIPAGGLDPSRQRWVRCRAGFFLPVRVLSRYFRKVFLRALERAYRKDALHLVGRSADLRHPVAFEQWLRSARSIEWVVYAKPPFGGPARVIRYLSRYTHRIAISNTRLLDVAGGKVSFKYRDSRRGNRSGVVTLEAEEFLRRFLLHVLPSGFVRIRHFGFLANRNRREKIERARDLLGREGTSHETPRSLEKPGPDFRICPECSRGRMICVETVAEARPVPAGLQVFDTS